MVAVTAVSVTGTSNGAAHPPAATSGDVVDRAKPGPLNVNSWAPTGTLSNPNAPPTTGAVSTVPSSARSVATPEPAGAPSDVTTWPLTGARPNSSTMSPSSWVAPARSTARCA